MTVNKEQLKLIGGGIVVLAAASIMFQPLLSYVAGLGRLIAFIVTVCLLAYLLTFVIVKMKGKSRTAGDTTNKQRHPDYTDEYTAEYSSRPEQKNTTVDGDTEA